MIFIECFFGDEFGRNGGGIQGRMGFNVHNNLLRLIRDGVGELGDGYPYPTTYSLHCHHQNDSALRRAAV